MASDDRNEKHPPSTYGSKSKTGVYFLRKYCHPGHAPRSGRSIVQALYIWKEESGDMNEARRSLRGRARVRSILFWDGDFSITMPCLFVAFYTYLDDPIVFVVAKAYHPVSTEYNSQHLYCHSPLRPQVSLPTGCATCSSGLTQAVCCETTETRQLQPLEPSRDPRSRHGKV